jgi:hypothetical protein
MWVITLVLVGALLIALTAIVLDSPIGRSFARRFEGAGPEPVAKGVGGDVKQLQRRVELLESEIADLHQALEGVREAVQFVQRLLEDPTRRKPPTP